VKNAGEDVVMNEDVLGPMRMSLEREEYHLNIAQSSQHENEEYHAQVVDYYIDRVVKIKALIASLESVQSLRESLALPITEDAREVKDYYYYYYLLLLLLLLLLLFYYFFRRWWKTRFTISWATWSTPICWHPKR
jgi:hypothetical protein